MKITKAVIPAAGLGTRVLPATKSMPKEMMPIIDKPAIEYIVKEAVEAGITDILIITNRGKGLIEDHFDRQPELEDSLMRSGKLEMLDQVRAITNLANIYFIRQKMPLGLGHAVSIAESFVGDDPFLVLYGDDIIVGDIPASKELIESYEKHQKTIVGVKNVPFDDIGRYSSLKLDEHLSKNEFLCTDMIEKPGIGEEFSTYAILGRCLLTKEIFPILRSTKPGVGGEIQLTDALAVLARENGIVAREYTGTRYDIGNRFGILQATVEIALKNEEIGVEFRDYIKKIAETL